MTTRPTLAEPITVAEFWKNRSGQSIRLTLSTYAGRNLIDLRTWCLEQGRLKPGKGFAAEARHLPQLVKAFAKACSRARELGLISSDDDGVDQ
jgi:Transcriptional Coactivator p15 (PC4)